MPELAKNIVERVALRDVNRLRFDAIDRGDVLLPWALRPCRMKILMVVDGYDGGFVNITFGRLYFSLSALCDLLENSPDWWIKFDLTKAHRQNDPLGAADMNGFRFTQAGFNINDYDQIWFFGARQNINDSQRLNDQELEIIARWMDERQGGVFAVGDHYDLGASLCGRIPRVATMRKWSVAQNPPQNFGLNRHDTLVRGHDNFYTFNDESDDIPMRTRVRRYPLWSSAIFQRRWAPHPVLCGKDGVIDILPDHPHEGEVIEPSNTTATFGFGSYTGKAEYPEVNGHRETPDIVAWARVQGDHTEGRGGQPGNDRNKGPATGKEFGAIGAYDGHQGNVGRVIVDSTWHHWMDVNLIGRPRSGDQVDPVPDDDPKAFGFEHTDVGRAHYARIKDYFLNVAKWLGAPAKQNCMFMRATWGFVIRYPLAELVSPRLPIWELGGFARDAIGRRASRCTLYSWILPHFPVWREFLPLDIRAIEKLPPELAVPNWEAFETYVVGGITKQMLELSYGLAEKSETVDDKQVADAMAKGMAVGAKAFSADLERSKRQGDAVTAAVTKAASTRFSADRFL
ncbi:hypothetical protein [Sphingopyxis sp.]|uniref:hypothetical protein n=1 Tax=Sphingopyxis sp. TaxID=1908224 RepID=UPI002FCAEBBF